MPEHNQRKQRIIDAAMETLKSCSIEDVSVRKIAAKAGLTTGAIYHFYDSKDDLLFDVMKENLLFSTRLFEQVTKHELNKKGPELVEEINNQVANRIRKKEQQKLHVQFFSNILKENCKIQSDYKKNYQLIIEDVGNLFKEAYDIDNDVYKKRVSSLIVAAMDGIAMQQALDVLPDQQEEIIQTFITFFNESIPAFLKKHSR